MWDQKMRDPNVVKFEGPKGGTENAEQLACFPYFGSI